MTLTKQQVEDLKNQLKSQVQNLPEDKKREAISQIDSMSAEALETMLQQQSSQEKTIFRLIVDGEVDSVKVGENQENIAVLSITPISKGHILIIPKTPVHTPKEIPKSALELAQHLTEKIVHNLKAKSAKAETEVQFGEAVLNLIPIYDKELSISSQRGKSSLEELKKIKKELETLKIEKKTEKIKIETQKKEAPLKIKRRIP